MLLPLVSWDFNVIWVLRCYAEPHPKYVADGTCLHSCLGMDYLPLCTGPLLLIWSGSVPLSPWWKSCQWGQNDQRCWYGHVWGGRLEMFLEPVFKISGWLPYVCWKKMLENNLDQHFLRHGRSHDGNLAKACLSTKKIILFLRKLAYLHVIKQNEKHPFIFNHQIWKGNCWNL